MRTTLPQWVAPGAGVLGSGSPTMRSTARDLEENVGAAAAALGGRKWAGPVGLLADNSPAWVSVDLAAHRAGIALVPLPDFFSPSQLEHIVRRTDMGALWCADARSAAALGFTREVPGSFELRLFERETPAASTADAGEPLQKITFTSGSTGAPKGVCLTAEQQLRTAQALAQVTAPLRIARHLNLLPLCVLLENIAGLYVPLITGATCVCPPLSEIGVTGASGFDAERCLDAIARHAPDSVILLPQMLRALVARLARQATADLRIRSLKFVAIGGAKTPPQLIGRARELGLPVYEGYGLSECASVVALNVPGADRVGSVGRALPGTRMRLAKDGEIELSGRGFSGYLGAPAVGRDDWFKTGDLGSIDADGYLYVEGRKGSLLITGYGRNVSPEWPESLLLMSPLIAHAAVFGEGRAHIVAVMAPSARDVPDAALDTAVAQANRQLPAYARIGAWVRAEEPFTSGNGLATANGRVRRQAVWERYGGALNKLYDSGSNHS